MGNIAIAASIAYELLRLINRAAARGQDVSDEDLAQTLDRAKAAQDRWYGKDEDRSS